MEQGRKKWEEHHGTMKNITDTGEVRVPQVGDDQDEMDQLCVFGSYFLRCSQPPKGEGFETNPLNTFAHGAHFSLHDVERATGSGVL